ncbi:hypothetical protein A0J61_05125, partial [Choanephora cucurbitarum]
MAPRILTAALLAGMIVPSLAQNNESGFVCDYPGSDGYYFAKNLTFWDMANDSCGSAGVLASITNRNFEIATDLVRNCIGDNAAAWIGTWDYTAANPQVRKCLTLYVGDEDDGGGINVDCGNRRYAFCRRRPERINGPEYPPYLSPTDSGNGQASTSTTNTNTNTNTNTSPNTNPASTRTVTRDVTYTDVATITSTATTTSVSTAVDVTTITETSVATSTAYNATYIYSPIPPVYNTTLLAELLSEAQLLYDELFGVLGQAQNTTGILSELLSDATTAIGTISDLLGNATATSGNLTELIDNATTIIDALNNATANANNVSGVLDSANQNALGVIDTLNNLANSTADTVTGLLSDVTNA